MFIHLSLHESTAKELGMPSLEMQNGSIGKCCQIINSLESVGMDDTVDTASRGV